MNLVGKNVVIYGAGVSGLSAYELVKEKGAKAIIYDDDKYADHATNSVGVFKDADIIVLSPGVNTQKDFLLDAKLENKLVMSELELAASCCMAQQIAVTGTNGKTTTTLLINHIFNYAQKKSHAVGNIGTAFSSIADKLDACEIAIIEASSFQLEECINFSPDTAVLLNITPDHLNRHKTLKNYISAKANVFLKQGEQDTVVYNDDDENIRSLIPQMVAKKVPFSLTHPTDGAYVSSGFVCFRGKPVIALSEIDMKGKEVENVLAAVAVTMTEGVSAFTAARAIASFERPAYRRKFCADINGVAVYNDSKATNVYSCLNAIEATEGDTVLILGGESGEEDFCGFFDVLDEKIKAIVTCGENSHIIFDCAQSARFVNISDADSELDTAIYIAFGYARNLQCKNILFSPASKSFDRYTGYAQRGAAFDAALKKYIDRE